MGLAVPTQKRLSVRGVLLRRRRFLPESRARGLHAAFLVKDNRRKKIVMNKHLLAQQLRQRQYAHGYLPRHLIVAVSDEDMLDSYITCSCCGEKQVTPRQLEVAIAQARDAYHFLMLCDEQARAASRGHIQLPPPGPNRPARRTHTGEGDVGVDQGRCCKEADFSGG